MGPALVFSSSAYLWLRFQEAKNTDSKNSPLQMISLIAEDFFSLYVSTYDLFAAERQNFSLELLWSKPNDLYPDRDLMRLVIKTQSMVAIRYLGLDLGRLGNYYNGFSLAGASRALRSNSDFMLKVVSHYPDALKYARYPLCQNRDFLLKAISKNPDVLKHVSQPLCQDRDFLLDAICANPAVLGQLNGPLSTDRKFLLEASSREPEALKYVDHTFRMDRDFTHEVVTKTPRALLYAHDSFQKDRDFTYDVVSKNGMALKYIHHTLCSNDNIVAAAVSNTGKALQCAPDRYRSDPDIIDIALKEHLKNFIYVSSFQRVFERIVNKYPALFNLLVYNEDVEYSYDDANKIINYKTPTFPINIILNEATLNLEMFKNSASIAKSIVFNNKTNQDTVDSAARETDSSSSILFTGPKREGFCYERDALGEVLQSCSQLTSLRIIGIPKVESLPFECTRDLKILYISDMHDLKKLTGVKHCEKLEEVFLIKVPKLEKGVIDQITSLPNLKRLVIQDCYKEEIFLTAGDLSKLEVLDVSQNGKVILPSSLLQKEKLRIFCQNTDLQTDEDKIPLAKSYNDNSLQKVQGGAKFQKNSPNWLEKLEAIDKVSRNSNALEQLSSDLRDDPEVVVKAIEQNWESFRFAGKKLRSDPDFVYEIAMLNYRVLYCAESNIKNDPDLFLKILKKNGRALSCAGKEVHNNLNVVMAAVTQNGKAYDKINGNLRDNQEIMLAAIETDGSVFEYFSPIFTESRDFCLKAVIKNPEVYQFIDEDFKDDRNFNLEAVVKNPAALQFIQKGWRTDRKFNFEAAVKNPALLECIKEDFFDQTFVGEVSKERSSRL